MKRGRASPQLDAFVLTRFRVQVSELVYSAKLRWRPGEALLRPPALLRLPSSEQRTKSASATALMEGIHLKPCTKQYILRYLVPLWDTIM